MLSRHDYSHVLQLGQSAHLVDDAANEENEQAEGAAVGQVIVALLLIWADLHLDEQVDGRKDRPDDELHDGALLDGHHDANTFHKSSNAVLDQTTWLVPGSSHSMDTA